MSKLNVCLSGVNFPNPVMPASGTFGFGYEMAQFYDLNKLGAIVLKGTTEKARYGNPTPRIAECREGLINAIGLQNPGVDSVISEELPKLDAVYSGVKIANISGFSKCEYVETAEAFDNSSVDILEINISCPNVHNGGMAFGLTPEGASDICRAVKLVCKKPVYMKLSPNVTDIAQIALACEDSGADGISLINTLLGMVIDPGSGRPVVSTKTAGFSGPAIKPVALRMVYQVYSKVHIPIIGIGGIATADDVLEFISAGATAVQVGAQNLIDPWAYEKIVDELSLKLAQYGISSISSIVGRSHTF